MPLYAVWRGLAWCMLKRQRRIGRTVLIVRPKAWQDEIFGISS
jgi:hypothetical protein